MLKKDKSNLLKLVSWNVNGIRAALKKGLDQFVADYKPDILCLQETKATRDQVCWQPEGMLQYWNSAEKKGYSGTAVFTVSKPLSVRKGMGVPEHDKEGRVLSLEFSNCWLVNVYTPNSQSELRRLAYRCKEWDVEFFRYLKDLEKTKPVIFCGDLNVAHKPVDLANPGPNRRNAGFTDEERAGFDQLIRAGFSDTFRMFCQEPGQYSWWSYRARSRERNVGWRIDYFCVSPALKERVAGAGILQSVMGSDHCPVTMDMLGSAL